MYAPVVRYLSGVRILRYPITRAPTFSDAIDSGTRTPLQPQTLDCYPSLVAIALKRHVEIVLLPACLHQFSPNAWPSFPTLQISAAKARDTAAAGPTRPGDARSRGIRCAESNR